MTVESLQSEATTWRKKFDKMCLISSSHDLTLVITTESFRYPTPVGLLRLYVNGSVWEWRKLVVNLD